MAKIKFPKGKKLQKIKVKKHLEYSEKYKKIIRKNKNPKECLKNLDKLRKKYNKTKKNNNNSVNIPIKNMDYQRWHKFTRDHAHESS